MQIIIRLISVIRGENKLIQDFRKLHKIKKAFQKWKAFHWSNY